LLEFKKIFSWIYAILHLIKCKGTSFALNIKKTKLVSSFFSNHLENSSEHTCKKKIYQGKTSYKNIKPKSILGFVVLISKPFRRNGFDLKTAC
jgi:hypothetical protein